MIFQKCECVYCKQHNNFPILWKLDTGIFWFEIPKNGSSSIKQTYKNRKHITKFTPYENAIPYIVMREPVERFISLFKHYFLKEGRRYTRGKDFFKKLGKNIESMKIDERLSFLLNKLDDLSTDDEVHHFYPQTYFIDMENYNSFNVVGMSNISNIFNTPMINHTKTNTLVDLDNKQEEYIKHIYREDYIFAEKFNFNF